MPNPTGLSASIAHLAITCNYGFPYDKAIDRHRDVLPIRPLMAPHLEVCPQISNKSLSMSLFQPDMCAVSLRGILFLLLLAILASTCPKNSRHLGPTF